MSTRVTIKDVAEEAGVSFALVSAVLGVRSKPVPIKPETRERIRAAAQKLGYRRNALASQMQAGCSNHIALISGYFEAEVAMRIITGALNEATSRAFHLKLSGFSMENTFREVIDRLLEQCPAAVISMSEDARFIDYLARECAKLNVPLVRADAYSDYPGVPRVLADDQSGVEQLVAHLTGLGCRRVGVVAVPYIHPYEPRRLEQFTSALHQAGLRLAPEHLFRGDETELETWLDRLMADPDRPQALLCCGDKGALTAMTLLTANGFRVPDDIMLTGYSDFAFASACRPALTTVRQNYEEMGAAAVRLLAERLRQGENSLPAGDLLVPTELCPRKSTLSQSKG